MSQKQNKEMMQDKLQKCSEVYDELGNIAVFESRPITGNDTFQVKLRNDLDF